MLTTGMWRFWYALSTGLHTAIKINVKLKKYDAGLNNLLAQPSS